MFPKTESINLPIATIIGETMLVLDDRGYLTFVEPLKGAFVPSSRSG